MSSGKRRVAGIALSLAATGFALAGGTAPSVSAQAGRAEPAGLFAVYAANRADGVSNVVTEDFVVLAYSMVLQGEVERAEAALQQDLAALVRGLDEALAKEKGEAPEITLARQFVSTLTALAADDPAARKPADAQVIKELALIDEASKMEASAITGLTVDFTQMKPRGRYTRNAEAARYFRTMRYASLLLFPLRATPATGTTDAQVDRLTASAVVLSRLVAGTPELAAAHGRLLSRTAWLFGAPDDLTVDDYVKVLPGNVTAGGADARAALLKAHEQRTPRIVGDPIRADALPAGMTAQQALLGWRLMPSRVTPDRVALQHLVYGGTPRTLRFTGTGEPRSVTLAPGVGRVRGFPLADDLLALLGSEIARQRIEAGGDHAYEGYAEAMGEASRALEDKGTLGGEHLALLKIVLGPQASDAARVNTAAALWTLDKHREVLYAKQSYTGGSKGIAPRDQRTHAWLDPSLETYQALRQQIDRAVAALGPSDTLQGLAAALDRLIVIARNGRAGTAPSADDVAFLNNVDSAFRALAERDDTPIATDVHTDPNSKQVLVQALAAPTVVEMPIGQDAIGRGALFTHVEFKHPMNDRLTDEAWQEMVRKGVPAARQASDRVREAFMKRTAANAAK